MVETSRRVVARGQRRVTGLAPLGSQQRTASPTVVSGTGIAPAGDFGETIGPGLLKQADAVAAVLEFVDVGPDLSLPGLVMNRRFAAACATSVQPAHRWRR